MWLLILFLISVPIFYIYGFIGFIRQFTGQQFSPSEKLQREIEKLLQNLTLAATERKKLEVAKRALETGSFSKAAATLSQNLETNLPEPVVAETMSPDSADIETPVQPQLTTPTDNSTVLLYVGAFLLLISASIFVAFNYQAFSGATKTILIAGAAALSYFSGLLLYQKSERFRSAGVTFTSLGLLFIPLVGLAAHSYVFLGTQPRLVWFGTSIAMVASYILALRILRTTFLQYLSLFTVVSLWCSAWSLFSVPIYYFGWLLVLLAGIFRWYQESKYADKTLVPALDITSKCMVPVAVVLSLGLTEKYGWGQFSVQAILAAGYYVLVGLRKTVATTRQWLSYVVVALLTASIMAAIRVDLGSFEGAKFGWWVMGLGGLYLVALEFVFWRETVRRDIPALQQWLKEIGISLTIWIVFLAIGGVLWQIGDDRELSKALWCFIGVLGWLTIRKKQPVFLALSLMGLFVQPFVLGSLSKVLQVTIWQSWWYVGLASVLLLAQWIFQNGPAKRSKDWEQVTWLGHTAAMALAGILVVNTQFWNWQLLVGVSLTVLLVLAARVTKQTIYMGLSWVVSLYVGYAAQKVTGWPAVWLPVWGMLLGLGWFGVGQIVTTERKRWYQILGLITLYLTAATRLWAVDGNWTALASLVIAGLLTIEDGRKRLDRSWMYLGGAVLLVAFEWYLFEFGQIKEVLVYSWLWSGYCAVLAYLVEREAKAAVKPAEAEMLQSQVTVFTVVALTALTFPLGWQALSDQLKGLELMGVDLCLIALGMRINKPLIWRWGIAVLVIQVLYLLKDFIFGLPTWAVFGGIGLGLVVAAIALLSRQRKS